MAHGSFTTRSMLEVPVFVGRHPLVLDLLDRVERLSRGSQPVLLLGETGTGKEILARMVHRWSPRRDGPFVTVNCAAVPAALLEGELFGALRGAYTGAVEDRQGLVGAAHGGTLFLDEVGDMPAPLQAALLRVLDGGWVRRLGETRESRVDVRVVAATHRNLSRLATEGAFRRDLLFRLGVPVQVPPLRARRSDLPLLVRAFLEEAAGGGVPPVLAKGTLAHLFVHPFPGNVRELRSRLLTAVALSEGAPVRACHLGLEAVAPPPRGGGTAEDRVRRAVHRREWVSIAEIERSCAVARRTAQRILSDLVRRGTVLRSGRGPATRYRAVRDGAMLRGDERTERGACGSGRGGGGDDRR